MTTDIFKALFIPGTLIFLLILAGSILVFSNNGKRGKYLLLFGILSYYFLSITPGANLIINPLEREQEHLSFEKLDEANIVVVLSGGKKSDVLRSWEALRISNLKDHQINIIISGTKTPTHHNEENLSAIEIFFASRGIPAENIYIEDNSKNTRENAQRVVEKIGQEPFFLVTSAYHMKRALSEFERLDANPIPAPTDFRAKNQDNYELKEFIPNSGNLRKADLAFHEYFGIIYYRLID